MKYSMSRRSTNIPSYVVDGLSDPMARKSAEVRGKLSFEVENSYREGKMSRVAFVDNIPHIKHGAGTFESTQDMSIWERHGDVIIRRNDSQMEVDAVLSALTDGNEEELE